MRKLVNAVLLASLIAAPAALAQVEPAGGAPVDAVAYVRPDLHVFHDYRPPSNLPLLEAALRAELDSLGVRPDSGFYDIRGGRWGSLVLTRPLIPGPGVGNTLQWSAGAPSSEDALKAAAWEAFRAFLAAHQAQLKVDPAELGAPHLTAHEGGRLIQMNARRVVDGVEVRDSLVTGVVHSGNLILYGTRNWGNGPVTATPTVSKETAAEVVAAHTRAAGRGERTSEPRLSIITLENGGREVLAVPVGQGYNQRLVWVLAYRFPGSGGSWEALVDAQDGALLAFTDRNQYHDRQATAGVFPISNDGLSPNDIPDGLEQAGWPLPFADFVQPFGTSTVSNTAGQVEDLGGIARTTLSGPFVRMNDFCGKADERAVCNDLDLGAGPGTDCDVPPGSSAGNTHASRTGFYEVNRIKELARGWLPQNAWLQDQITANMNIPLSCNAFWDGSTINFYKDTLSTGVTSGGRACRNTGESAAVFDHEWGHGMDDNDALPTISSPGEAPADIYAMTRLNTSCIARGFFKTGNCSGQGDPCLACSGVREVDWTKRRSGLPHDIAWILRPTVTPGVPGVLPSGGCVGATVPIPVVQTGPCLVGTHCEGSVVVEAAWDLMHRDLRGFQGSPFNLDVNTTLNLVTRLQYLGGGNVNFWFQCNPSGIGGCLADGGYMNYLAADDDNGSLEDGTPHMTAIHAAFARHQMACPVPAPVNSGCSGAPAAPSATATAVQGGVSVSWNAVAGAESYWLFRADGLHGCDFGKERIAITTSTDFLDTGLMPDRTYFYTVEAVGASPSCRSAASACAPAVPLPAEPRVNALLAFREVEGGLTTVEGDGDAFLDNCETSRFAFQVENAGGIDLHNVRIESIEALSHPETRILTSTPVAVAGSIPAGGCGAEGTIASTAFTFVPGGLAADEVLELRLTVTADELLSPLVGTIRLQDTESDFVFAATKTFSFESDFERWRIVSGTYTREPVGANATLTHLASSSFLPGQCDRIQSPEIRLTETSTLSLFNQFNTEPGTDETGFYDRGNVGLLDVVTGDRPTVSPDGGRTYNASGPGGVCVTAFQPGWAGAGPGFLPSTWSAAALGSAARAGRRLRLDVAYGTDPLVEGAGFQFDEVTLTNVDVAIPDAQDDACVEPPPCGAIDDADAAVEYTGGWHRRADSRASGGGYHRRLGSKNGGAPVARVTFASDEITYFYVKSDIGGAADVFVDGVHRETLSYGPGGTGKENPTFGHSVTYAGLGPGTHTLEIRHRGGAVYVDGFDFACEVDAGADAAAARSHSVTESASGSGAVIEHTVTVGAKDQELSVVVEGAASPLAVSLLDALGALRASGGALLPGLPASGLDAGGLPAGTYTIRVLNPGGDTLSISVARTVAR